MVRYLVRVMRCMMRYLVRVMHWRILRSYIFSPGPSSLGVENHIIHEASTKRRENTTNGC
jgi:hypothetical protein